MDTFDVNDFRTLVTVLSFIVFAGIVFWAYSSHQKARFDEAANLPFADTEGEMPGEKPPVNAAENRRGARS